LGCFLGPGMLNMQTCFTLKSHCMKKLRSIIIAALFIAMSFGLSGCLDSVDAFFFKPKYTVSGVDANKDLKDDLDAFIDERAATLKKPKNKAESADVSRYQAGLLRTDLVDVMKSKGYYDAAVDFKQGKEDWQGIYVVNAGAQYKITSVTLKPARFDKYFHRAARLQDKPLDAAAVLKAEAGILKSIQKDSCAFTLEVTHEVLLDPKAKTASVAFTVKEGEKAVFGPVTFENNGKVSQSYLAKMVPWKEGECFRRDKIEEFRASLLQTALFSRADLVLPPAPKKGGVVPMTLQLKERPPRSVSFGLSYYTDEGPGVSASWKHRNFLGSGETMEASAKISSLLQSLDAKLTSPFFLRKDQSLTLNADLTHEDSDAYVERNLDTGASIKRVFSKRFSATTGVNLEFSNINDKSLQTTDTFGLLSFPQTATFDNRDNPLDARHGWLLSGSAEPFIDMLGTSPAFWKMEGDARTYVPFGKRFTLAGRAKLGSLLGPSTLDVPATKRFYAGGGGSVRGFGYQDVGPMTDGKPTGGRSLAEASAEARLRFTKSIGAVAFLDAGSVSETVAPDFSNLSVGAGLGLRYYTSFGPLRLDVGVPLNNKEDTSSYQLYISIGQAF